MKKSALCATIEKNRTDTIYEEIAMNIITITLNPAVDLHYSLERLTPLGYNEARFMRRDSGGKGVNLSRALLAGGVKSTCYIALGKAGAEEFLSPIRECGIDPLVTLVDGRARENINLMQDGGETVIASVGPRLGEPELADMEKKLAPLVDSDTVIVLAGSIPKGTDKYAVLKILMKFHRQGAKIAVDSKSFDLEDIIPLSPYLAKPNEDEAQSLTGIAVTDKDSAIKAALAIRDMGVEAVLLSMGADGAVLATESGVYVANAPRITPVSTVGAGDSTLGGFLASKFSGMSDADSLRSAVAFGSAACLEEGSMPPRSAVIKKLLPEIDIKREM